MNIRTDWFDLLAVQGTLRSLPQHHNLKALVQHSAFFMINPHPYTTTGKTTAWTVQTFVGKMVSWLSNRNSTLNSRKPASSLVYKGYVHPRR